MKTHTYLLTGESLYHGVSHCRRVADNPLPQSGDPGLLARHGRHPVHGVGHHAPECDPHGEPDGSAQQGGRHPTETDTADGAQSVTVVQGSAGLLY